jgi:hypothetical protein
LRFVELTHANCHWLLTGRGERYHGSDATGEFRGRRAVVSGEWDDRQHPYRRDE